MARGSCEDPETEYAVLLIGEQPIFVRRGELLEAVGERLGLHRQLIRRLERPVSTARHGRRSWTAVRATAAVAAEVAAKFGHVASFRQLVHRPRNVRTRPGEWRSSRGRGRRGWCRRAPMLTQPTVPLRALPPLRSRRTFDGPTAFCFLHTLDAASGMFPSPTGRTAPGPYRVEPALLLGLAGCRRRRRFGRRDGKIGFPGEPRHRTGVLWQKRSLLATATATATTERTHTDAVTKEALLLQLHLLRFCLTASTRPWLPCPARSWTGALCDQVLKLKSMPLSSFQRPCQYEGALRPPGQLRSVSVTGK